ncbi:CheA signal transduction histidine kinase [Natrialba hulunbeirensis JCM 10989]|uniref:Chemotaxis protein CheA n=1 Tax=Natrialba hulunbeirensis JCM 10989 TaxID=1227493 RepID=L9ZPY1_9EURY|nr:ATP-binding protein [Natrialba hulunbeirensis]ELY87612.1 CheA signal transduction histidine kinase [Natrialba hulunbeirensis JCM 10989]
MTEYWTDFVRESEDRITELNNALLTLERSPDDAEAMENIFRIAHTLKGNCGAAGLESASDLAHAIEDVLDAVRRDRLEVTPELMDAIFDGVDELEKLIEEVALEGEIQTDPQPTIDALRAQLESAAAVGDADATVGLTEPSQGEIEDVLSRFEPPADANHNAYFARIEVDTDAAGDGRGPHGHDDLDNGLLVVEALIDAFDLIGTVPDRQTIADGAYGATFDAIFGSAVGEESIASGLDPVGEVAEFELVDVSEEFAAVATGDGSEPEPAPGAALSADEAQDLEVDDLLDEFTEFDDLDEKVEEVDDSDLDVFDDMGDAGSFDDLLADADADFEEENLADATGAVDAGGDSAAEPVGDAATDAVEDSPDTARAESPAPAVDPGSPDDEVDDAEAVFAELKSEVDTVGFDELQDELDELEFDEFDQEDEVSMDELLGDAADPDEPFLAGAGSESVDSVESEPEPESESEFESDPESESELEPGTDPQTDTATAVSDEELDDLLVNESVPEETASVVDVAADEASGGESPTAGAAETDERIDSETDAGVVAETGISADEPTDTVTETETDTDAEVEGTESVDTGVDESDEIIAAGDSSEVTDDGSNVSEPTESPDDSAFDFGIDVDDGQTAADDSDDTASDSTTTTTTTTTTTAADDDRGSDDVASWFEDADTDTDTDTDSSTTPFGHTSDTAADAADVFGTTDATDTPADETSVSVTETDESVPPADSETVDDGLGEAVEDEAALEPASDIDSESESDSGSESESDSEFTVDAASDSKFTDDGDSDSAPTADSESPSPVDDETDSDFDSGLEVDSSSESDFAVDSSNDSDLDTEFEPAESSGEESVDVADDGDADVNANVAADDATDTSADNGTDTTDSEFTTVADDSEFATADTPFNPSIQDDVAFGDSDSDRADATDADAFTSDVDADAGSFSEPDSFDDWESDSDDGDDTLEDDAFADLDIDFGDDAADIDTDPQRGSLGEEYSSPGGFDETDTAESESEADATVDATAGFGTEADSGPVVEEPNLEIPDITVPETAARPDTEREGDETQSVRVDVEQIDELLTLVEGLVTSRVRLRHEVESGEFAEAVADAGAITAELDDLESLTTDLQETVMDVRLVPLRTVANRLPRVVRDIAREQEKTVAFEMTGEDVELDRSILDQLRDPLIHLVRNAVDHGIESPSERAESDKPEEGTVEVTAERERDRVTISVSDDGSGLDPERLRSEAADADVLSEADAADLTDEDVTELIFHPGLSTASEVTDVSGRGVGMDVVKRTIEDLDGTVEIDSEPGEGTTVTMTVPVSIAIDDVLFVESGGEEYGIPTKAVSDIVPVELVETEDGDPVLRDDEARAADTDSAVGTDVASDATADAAVGSNRADVSDTADETADHAESSIGTDTGTNTETGTGTDTDTNTNTNTGTGTPVLDLDNVLASASDDGTTNSSTFDGDEQELRTPAHGMVVRIREDVRPIALRCDAVHGQQEVVVKPFEGFMANLPGLSGATVRGRGKIVNILDVTTL